MLLKDAKKNREVFTEESTLKQEMCDDKTIIHCALVLKSRSFNYLATYLQ